MKKLKIFSLFTLSLVLCINYFPQNTKAVGCQPLTIIFARGSGETQNTGENFKEFSRTLKNKLSLVSIPYNIIDLEYPAVGLDIENLGTLLGAFISGGEAYDFGKSVNAGVAELQRIVDACPVTTRFVIAGYSQGAMVISKALNLLNPERIIYAATFGDPKLYLPEGAGLMPAACSNRNLSEYRAYVPDCFANEGLLGGYKPYQPSGFSGKLGTWCNKFDLICSRHFSISDHVSYIKDGIYEDAAKMIFSKITAAFGIHNNYTSPHDTAILIDSTGSMYGLIERYKSEALRLAEETLRAGGRIALYEYRDLADPFSEVEHCSFETCTLEIFQRELNTIRTEGGGDDRESLLSASFHMMQRLNWKYGSTKSVVILTDNGYLSPDRDGVTFSDVVNLSRSIDPVNFYVITRPGFVGEYSTLAEATDGLVMADSDHLHLITEQIMARFDSLPTTELTEESLALPVISFENISLKDEHTASINIDGDADQILITLNDQILGLTKEHEFSLSDLDLSKPNVLKLTPIKDEVKGEVITCNLITYREFGEALEEPIVKSAPVIEPEPEPDPEPEPEPEPILGLEVVTPFIEAKTPILTIDWSAYDFAEKVPVKPSEPATPDYSKIKAPDTGFKPKNML